MASSSVPTRDDIIEALRPVEDPELHRSIVDLNMVRDIDIDLPVVTVLIALTISGCPLKDEITRRVSEAVTSLEGVDQLKLNFTSMTDAERAALREHLERQQQLRLLQQRLHQVLLAGAAARHRHGVPRSVDRDRGDRPA